jgi:hypothetical protein
MCPIRTTRAVVSFIVTAMLTACATGMYSGGTANYAPSNEVPIASNFATSTQKKLQAAEHWRRVANHAAARLSTALRAGNACIPKTGCVTLYVKRACEASGCIREACDTTFNRVFYNDLVTALVAQGYPVSTVPTVDAVVVDIDIQAVSFTANRPQYRYAGEPVEIGPGTWALRDPANLIDAHRTLAPRTEGYDSNWYRTQFAGGETPRNELVITTSAVSPSKTYLGRDTAVYYTSDSDAQLYFCVSAGVGTGARTPRETPTWNIPVVGDCTGERCVDDGRRSQR